MIGTAPPPPRPWISWQLIVFVGVAIVFGTAGGGLFPWGPALGVGGVTASAVFRRLEREPRGVLPFVPVALSLSLMVALARPSPATDLLAGLLGLSFLLWLTDDPDHPVGGERRGAPAFAAAAVATLLAWALALLKLPIPIGSALAVGLLAMGILLLAGLLARLAVGLREPTPIPSRDVDSDSLDRTLGVRPRRWKWE